MLATDEKTVQEPPKAQLFSLTLLGFLCLAARRLTNCSMADIFHYGAEICGWSLSFRSVHAHSDAFCLAS